MSTNIPTLLDALDDVEARFLYNLPLSELNQADRLFFQIEQAYWYYEDFKADKFSHLPHFSHLKKFAEKIFSHCPLLQKMGDKFQELFSTFTDYKSKIPVFGCIMLNPKMNKAVLVCDYNSKSWMFPRGKINEKESEFTCAIREVVEEVGFDPTPYCKEEDNLLIYQDGKMVKLFIATGIPENTVFNTQTRKEISKIEFHPLDAIPKNSYGVHPFIPKILRWISQRGKGGRNNQASFKSPNARPLKAPVPQQAAAVVTAVKGKDSKRRTASVEKQKQQQIKATKILNSQPSPGTMKRLRNTFDQRNTDTFAADGAAQTGWGVTDMFAANSKITGLNYKYNGNPHEFGSSHPKFVDYRSAATPQSSGLNSNNKNGRSLFGASGSAEESLLELQELSKQSLLGQKMMRIERGGVHDLHGDDDDHPPAFSLPSSAAFNNSNRNTVSLKQELLKFGAHPPSIVTIVEPYRWTSARLSFKFNKSEVMSAMDSVLLRTQSAY